MASGVVKFVDAIAASPTTRLDLNDGTTWKTKHIDAPPPRLRRALSQNAMRDGGLVSSAQYDLRVLSLDLLLVASSQDLGAAQLQLLARELDRTDNFLMYQPNGMTKPVFFRVMRSDYSGLAIVRGQTAAWEGRVELLCEPFALGIKESLGPFTVNNDPAHATNGLYFDATGVIGDVAVPAVFTTTTSIVDFTCLSVRQRGTPTDLVHFIQAESSDVTLGTDTTNPGGGPDAVMSGTGTNNYVTTSFGTSTSLTATRLTWELDTDLTAAQATALKGEYRVFACVRRSSAVGVVNVGFSRGSSITSAATALTAARQLVDVGVVAFGGNLPAGVGYSTTNVVAANEILFHAERTSGSSTLDWDYILLMPADERMLMLLTQSSATARDVVVDGVNEATYYLVDGADPWTGAMAEGLTLPSVSGGYPLLVPGRTNRVFLVTADTDAGGGAGHVKSTTTTLSVHYWPGYLSVRPSAS